MEKYNDKFLTTSNRLSGFDYGSSGGYFITICTKDRKNYFGEVINGKMVFNEIGIIVENEIINIEKFRGNVVDSFVVMPNHIHLLIYILNECRDVSLKHLLGNKDDLDQDVPTERLYTSIYSKISPKKGLLGNIIKLFKSYSTKNINKTNYGYFSWQPNYHDHIIRNEQELEKIRKYIIENPLKRELDKYYSN